MPSAQLMDELLLRLDFLSVMIMFPNSVVEL